MNKQVKDKEIHTDQNMKRYLFFSSFAYLDMQF